MVMAMSIMAPIMAALVATVAAIALGALADHIVQAAEESAAHAPKVKPSDADFHPNGDYEAGGNISQRRPRPAGETIRPNPATGKRHWTIQFK